MSGASDLPDPAQRIRGRITQKGRAIGGQAPQTPHETLAPPCQLPRVAPRSSSLQAGCILLLIVGKAAPSCTFAIFLPITGPFDWLFRERELWVLDLFCADQVSVRLGSGNGKRRAEATSPARLK